MAKCLLTGDLPLIPPSPFPGVCPDGAVPLLPPSSSALQQAAGSPDETDPTRTAPETVSVSYVLSILVHVL